MVAQRENPGVVDDQIIAAFFSVKYHPKATNIAVRISSMRFCGQGGNVHEKLPLITNFGERLCTGKLGDIAVQCEGVKQHGPFAVWRIHQVNFWLSHYQEFWEKGHF